MRLVSGEEDGTLFPGRHYRMADGTELGVLDSFRVDVTRHHPTPHQPENWLFRNPDWQRGDPSETRALIDLLKPHVAKGPDLFGTDDDRVAYDAFSEHPAKTSLCLVDPGSSLRFQITPDYRGNPHVRVLFQLGPRAYNLVLTDPVWQQRCLRSLPDGVCTPAEAGLRDDDMAWLTISLGEPFNGYCYKLVAAILVLPRLTCGSELI